MNVGTAFLVHGTKKLTSIGGLILPFVRAALLQALLHTVGMEADDVIEDRK